MKAYNVRNQCLFLAVYALCVLIFAGIMSSAQTGHTVPYGMSSMTKSERFLCTSCKKGSLPAFFLSKRACKIHIGKSKKCSGAEVKKVFIMTRPGNVIAGGSAGMVPCPPPPHQPTTLYMTKLYLV